MAEIAFSTESLSGRFGALLEELLLTRTTAGHCPHTDSRVPYARSAAQMVAGLVLLRRMERADLCPAFSVAAQETAMVDALASLEALQRGSGRFDEPTCNADSPPDTGFVVLMLCEALELARGCPGLDPAVPARIVRTLQSAYEGMKDGGHHTPNHRWVICSSLVRIQTALGLSDAPCLKAYRREGLDLNADGAWLERSAGGYDAVNNRAMQFLHHYGHWNEALPAAVGNLDLDSDLLHPDLTVESAMSSRWDAHLRLPPLHLADCYLRSALWAGRRDHGALAATLVRRFGNRFDLEAAFWTLSTLKLHGEPESDETWTPGPLRRLYPETGLWRWRGERLSVTAMAEASNLLTLRFGEAAIAAVRIQQSYFGPAGHFVADVLEAVDKGVILHNSGRRHPRRPGYDLPLDETVGARLDSWHAAEMRRDQRRLPEAAGDLSISAADNALEFRLVTTGTESVPGQVSVDFVPGGIWFAEGNAFKPVAGQEIGLHQGFGRMVYGSEIIEIGPGREDPVQFNMRDSITPGQTVRVILPFTNPADFGFRIACRRGW